MRIEVRELEYRYPSQAEPTLRGMTFDIPSGTRAAIIGPSGSGKTTLLSLIGGLLQPDRGEVRCQDNSGALHRVGDRATWVLQTVSLLGNRSSWENVAVGAFSDGADLAEARARSMAALSAVGLADRSYAAARFLSGGEAQRVAVARALASCRPVILADEPTGQLDATNTAGVLEAMLSAKTTQTVVIVTHDPAVASLCDLVLEIRDGQIVRPEGEGDRLLGDAR